MKRFSILFLFVVMSLSHSFGQRTILRGNVYGGNDGNSVIAASVYCVNANKVSITDEEGAFSFFDLSDGKNSFIITSIGFDTLYLDINVKGNGVTYKKVLIYEAALFLDELNVTSKSTKKRREVSAGVITIKPKELKLLPSIGGSSDIAQYLPVLPGIVSTGDQGGQIYIRGGSPVQNKIMLDGMTIFNPFHSIGLFSVFETEAIKSIDVLSAGYNVEHGGRMSAVVDISMREGNKKKIGGMVGISPFAGKILIEAPIIPIKPDRPFSSSILFTAKKSFIEQASKKLYEYANEDGLPFFFEDYYGKINFSLDNGSKVDIFGFNFNDKVNYNATTKFNWKNTGGGANFRINPSNSSFGIGGVVNFSTYEIKLEERDYDPRVSSLDNFTVGLDLTKYRENGDFKVGIEILGYTTDFSFTNFLNSRIEQTDNSTELGVYAKYKLILDKIVLEPGVRLHYYTAVGEASFEPRFGLKYNMNETIRLKLAGGLYSQNLISSVDDRDVVNLFSGFLTGSDDSVRDPFINENSNKKIQKAIHGVFGIEWDANRFLEFNLEPYAKKFGRILNINRNKQKTEEANYFIEKGFVYGIDLTAKYNRGRYSLWATYSYSKVNRDDAVQKYPTIYDRTHNVNLLGSVAFGMKRDFEISARLSHGSGFPFTRATGFFEQINSTDLDTNFGTSNGQIGVIYENKRNAGRLPYYQRLDVSVKKTFNFSRNSKAELSASCTNLLNRANLFYFNRLTYERVDQLPIMPSIALNLFF